MNISIKKYLFAMVLSACKQHGMTPKEVASMFCKSNVEKGYQILAEAKP